MAEKLKVVIIAGPNEADCPVFVNADLIAAGLENFHRVYAPVADLWAMYDNTGESSVLMDWSER